MSLLFTVFALVVCAVFHEVARAQEDGIISQLLSGLDTINCTNFTAIVRQVQADTTQPTFFSLISDTSTPRTLFVPDDTAFIKPNTNFFGYPFEANDTAYLASLLLYHLIPGAWTSDDLGVGLNHTVVPTTLEGRNLSFLESDEAQSIAMGYSVNAVEIYNQYQTTTTQVSFEFGNLTIYTINSIIGIPGPFSFGTNFLGLNQFAILQNSSGSPELDNQHGLTVFAPSDQAFDAVRSQLSSLSPADVFANHIIVGRTVYYPDFQADVYTASSGFNYTLTLTPDQGYTVTLNNVTANILRSDFLTNNGVIHIIDSVFWNTTAEPVPSPSSSVISAPAAIETSQGSDPVSVTLNSPPPSSKLSLGSIVGIIAIVIFAVSLPGIGYLVWKYRRAMQGAKVRHANHISLFDLPSAALRTTPFSQDATDSTASESGIGLTISDMEFVRGSVSGTSSADSPISQARPRIMREKPTFTNVMYQSMSPNNSGSSREIQSSAVSSPHSRQAVPPIPMTPEMVDHLWQEFAQRIDRGPPRRRSEAPPTYPSGSPPV
ncbi:hypothetical protein NM688_g8006 [Phlebia brevispora]|uniref:Uncharacterized protein n=1 Tax=Phlebia brevispora TaxID=194682 RepID=A0ACC1RYR3_9APHY|nr:hypothetical protein NM688_g8006 [Phlebia brevispora]